MDLQSRIKPLGGKWGPWTDEHSPDLNSYLYNNSGVAIITETCLSGTKIQTRVADRKVYCP